MGRREIIVTGMHRSGTSAVANFLAQLDISIGKNEHLVPGSQENEKGFFEDKRVITINDFVLQACNSTWDRPEIPFDLTRNDYSKHPTIKSSLYNLVDEYRKSKRSFLLKDPRFSLTLPFWKEVLNNPLIVVCLRSPVEVAKSLQSRNGFSLFKGLGLWEFYLRELFKACCGLDVIIVNFNHIMEEPEKECEVLVEKLKEFDISDIYFNTKDVLAVFDNGLRHERSSNKMLGSILTEGQISLWESLDSGKWPEQVDEKINNKIVSEFIRQENTDIGYADPFREVQLFYGTESGFSEECSYKKIRNSLDDIFNFDIIDNLASQFRFDPAAEACVIDDVNIEYFAKGQWHGVEEIEHNGAFDEKSGKYYFWINDPWFKFSTPSQSICKVRVVARLFTFSRSETLHELNKYLTHLESRNKQVSISLQEQYKLLENDNNHLVNEKNNIENEKKYLKVEINHLLKDNMKYEATANYWQQRFDSILSIVALDAQNRNFISKYFKKKKLMSCLFLARNPRKIKEYLYYCKNMVQETVFFSKSYYQKTYPDINYSSLSPQDHYFFRGWKEGRNPSPYFNTSYYLSNSPDVRRAGINPLVHYATLGWQEGRNPSEGFNTAGYIARHMNIFFDNIHPLVHWYAHIDDECTDNTNSSLKEFIFKERQYKFSKAVDIIVPVYLSSEASLQIFSKLICSLSRSYPSLSGLLNFIFIDDCSPVIGAEKVLSEYSLLGRGDISFYHNQDNLGFVSTVQKGFLKCRKSADVVLLNCDTEIHGNVFERLQSLCHRYPRIASVTPLSNRATIACLENCPYGVDFVYGMSPEEISEVVHEAGLQSPVIGAPTGHGFCMYINREALSKVGGFDVETFGKGYGEENDWSVRAVQEGFSHLISLETYVHHHETQSFTQKQKSELSRSNYQRLLKKHPWYAEMVGYYLEKNPLHDYRQLLRYIAGRGKNEKGKTICFILHDSFHSYFGGVQRHVRDICERMLSQEVFELIIISPRTLSSDKFELTAIRKNETLTLEDLTEKSLVQILEKIGKGIDCLHVHHMMGMSHFFKKWIQNLSVKRKIFTFHDFAVFGKNPCLINKDGEFGLESKDNDRVWLRTPEDIAEDINILSGFSDLLVPSKDTMHYLQEIWPENIFMPELQVVPHFLSFVDEISLDECSKMAEGNAVSKNIIFLGALCEHKGGSLFLGALPLLRKCRLDPWLFGLADPVLTKKFPDDWVPIVPYKNWKELLENGNRYGVHIVVIPSIVAETFSYTLYEALFVLQVPVIVGAYGNPANVVRDWGVGIVLSEMSPVAIRNAAVEIDENYEEYMNRVHKFTVRKYKSFSGKLYIRKYLENYMNIPRGEGEDKKAPYTIHTSLSQSRIIESRQGLLSSLTSFRMLLVHSDPLSPVDQMRCENIKSGLKRGGCSVKDVSLRDLFIGLDCFDIIYIYNELSKKKISALIDMAKLKGIPVVCEIDADDSAMLSLPPYVNVDYIVCGSCKKIPVSDSKNTVPLFYLENYWDESQRSLYAQCYNNRPRIKRRQIGFIGSQGNPIFDRVATTNLDLIMRKNTNIELTIFGDDDNILIQSYPDRTNIVQKYNGECYLNELARCKAVIITGNMKNDLDLLRYTVMESCLIGTPVITPFCAGVSDMLEYNFTGWPIRDSTWWEYAINTAMTEQYAEKVGRWAHDYVLQYYQLNSSEICRLFAGMISDYKEKETRTGEARFK